MKLKDINIKQPIKKFLVATAFLGTINCAHAFNLNRPTASENKKVNIEKDVYNNDQASKLLSDILFNQYDQLKDLPDAEFKREIVKLIKKIDDAYMTYGCFALALEGKNFEQAKKTGLSEERIQKIVKREISAPVDELIKTLNVEMPHHSHMFTDSSTLISLGAEEGVVLRADERYPVNTYIKFNTIGKRDVCAESISIADAYINDFITYVSAYYDYKGQDSNKIKNLLIKNFSKIMTLTSKDNFTEADKQVLDTAMDEIYSVLPHEMFGDSQMCKAAVTTTVMPYVSVRLFNKLKQLGHNIDECIADGLAQNAKHVKKDVEKNSKSVENSYEINPDKITIDDVTFIVDATGNINLNPDIKPFGGFSVDVKGQVPLGSSKNDFTIGGGFEHNRKNGKAESNTVSVDVAVGRNWNNTSHTEIQVTPGVKFLPNDETNIISGLNVVQTVNLKNNFAIDVGSYNSYNFNKNQLDLGFGAGVVFNSKYGRFRMGFDITYFNKTIIKKYGEIVNTPSLGPGTDRPELDPGEKIPN